MELLLFKNEDILIKEGISRLEKTSLNISGSSGKIVRLLLNIVNSLLAGGYNALKVNHFNAFLSTATGSGVDNLGAILNVYRFDGESDNDLKYRISQKTLTMATANQASIRLAALSIAGVEDIKMREFTNGTGSFGIYVISKYAITPNDILSAVQTEINSVKGYGIKVNVLSPVIKDVETNIVVSYTPAATDIDKQIIQADVRNLVINYINSKSMGETLILRTLLNNIITSNVLIKDAYMSSLRIDGKLVFLTNQECRWNQRFLASTRDGAINIQGE